MGLDRNFNSRFMAKDRSVRDATSSRISILLKDRKPRLIVCRFQGIVKRYIVVEGVLKGIPIPVEFLTSLGAKA